MINKSDLKDWLDENARNEYVKELEEFIDESIKRNALAGKTTFNISTGRYTKDGSRRTGFYSLWYTDKLSKENRKVVQDRVLDRYREYGFDVQKTTVDCGWHNNYFALMFKDIDKVVEQ